MCVGLALGCDPRDFGVIVGGDDSSEATTRPRDEQGRWVIEVTDERHAEVFGIETVHTHPRRPHVAYVDVEGPIRLVLANGETHDSDPVQLQIWQRGGKVTHAVLLFRPETLEEAAARFRQLSEQWDVDLTPKEKQFERWIDQRRNDPNRREYAGYFGIWGDQAALFPRKVEFRPAFHPDTPWYAKLVIHLGPPGDPPTRPATQPATRSVM